MIYYNIVIAILIFIALIFKKNIGIYICSTIFFLFAAFRAPSVGTDVSGYFSVFDDLLNHTIYEQVFNSGLPSSRDPFFYIIVRILKTVGISNQMILALIALLVAISCGFIIYKYSCDYFMTYLLLFCLRFYIFTFSGLRAAVAQSILILALPLLFDGKKIKFVIWIIIASLFHKSALFSLFMVPLVLLKNISVILLSGIIIIVLDFYTNIFSTVTNYITILSTYENYIIIPKENTRSGLTTIVIYLAISIIYLLFFLNKKKQDKMDNINYKFYKITIFGVLFYILNLRYPNASRIGDFFCIYYCILLPNMLNKIGEKYNENIIIKIMLVLLLIIQFNVYGAGAGSDNYIFFWNK